MAVPITRFAPSPTGALHMGGARTALFNWLFARSRGGKFLIRMEDTDPVRSKREHAETILADLAWLGLDHDGVPAIQSAREGEHRALVDGLLARGDAYRCYADAEQLAAWRAMTKEGRRPENPWRDGAPAPSSDAPFVARLKTPREGDTVIRDVVQGDVVVKNATLDDMALSRSDGTPTYMLAVVADDIAMGVTHIIRGVDHLTNAARQTHIWHALKAGAGEKAGATPIWAHIPLIHDERGAKLSKRQAALSLASARLSGYLPSAVMNWLARMGWSHGDDEVFAPAELVSLFSLEAVGKAPARLDLDKLASLNGRHLRTHDSDALAAMTLERLAERGTPAVRAREWITAMLDELTPRAKNLEDMADMALFALATPPAPDAKASRALQDAAPTLAALAQRLTRLDAKDWNAETLEAITRERAEALGVKLGLVAQPLRCALTGRAVSPGLFRIMATLGREETLERIIAASRNPTKGATPA